MEPQPNIPNLNAIDDVAQTATEGGNIFERIKNRLEHFNDGFTSARASTEPQVTAQK